MYASMNDIVLTVMVFAWTSVKYPITLLIPITYTGHYCAFKFWLLTSKMMHVFCRVFRGYRLISWLPFIQCLLAYFNHMCEYDFIYLIAPIWSMGNLSNVIYIILSSLFGFNELKWLLSTLIYILSHYFDSYLSFLAGNRHPIWQHCTR